MSAKVFVLIWRLTEQRCYLDLMIIVLGAKSLQSCPTLWTVASLSLVFFRQEYWRGFPFLPPGNHPHPGIEPASLRSSALAGRFFTASAIWEAKQYLCSLNNIFSLQRGCSGGAVVKNLPANAGDAGDEGSIPG